MVSVFAATTYLGWLGNWLFFLAFWYALIGVLTMNILATVSKKPVNFVDIAIWPPLLLEGLGVALSWLLAATGRRLDELIPSRVAERAEPWDAAAPAAESAEVPPSATNQAVTQPVPARKPRKSRTQT